MAKNWKLETGNWKPEMSDEKWAQVVRSLLLTPYSLLLTPYSLLLLASCLLLLSGCSTTALTQAELTLTASGTIRAQELRAASEFGGRVQTIPVQLGDTVQAGDVLVTLDATPWLLQLSPAEAAVEVARADLAALRAKPFPAEVEAARNALVLAEVQRDNALVAWENARALVENPQEIDAQIIQARAQVALAAQGVELAEAVLAKQQLLRDQTPADSVARTAANLQVKAYEESLAAAQADEQTAQALLNQLYLIRKNPLGYIAQANAAEGQYQVAEKAVAVAQAKLDDVLAGPTAAEIAMAEATVRRAEAEAGVLRVKVARSTLTSTLSGVVVAKSVGVGELVAPAATILTLADLSVVTLEVYVPEGRIGQVQLGQTVTVTVDSFPGRSFIGQVFRIGDEPEFTPRNVATAEERLNTFYAVEIRLDNADGALKPGMPADAEF